MTHSLPSRASHLVCSVLLASLATLGSVGCANEALDAEESAEVVDELRSGAGAALCTGLDAASRELCVLIPDNGWRDALKAELTKPYFRKLADKAHPPPA